LKTKVKKILVGIVGGLVLLAGIAMMVLPGPAFIVIPAGLAILATEFIWAKKLRDRVKHRFLQAREKHRQKKRQRSQAFST
jgi:uncharacterized protein (TIGR02611 family)